MFGACPAFTFTRMSVSYEASVVYVTLIPLAAPNASSSAWKPSACAPPKPPKMVTSSTALAEGAIATVADGFELPKKIVYAAVVDANKMSR